MKISNLRAHLKTFVFWFRFVVSIILSGAASAIVDAYNDPTSYTFSRAGFHKMLAVAGVGAVIGLAHWFLRSPLSTPPQNGATPTNEAKQ